MRGSKRYLVMALMGAALAVSPTVRAHDGHVHKTHDVAAETAPKIVEFRIVKDAVEGWNVFVAIQKFEFAPELVNGSNVDNKGHAHLYINGSKLARLYGPAYHIESLPFGPHEMKIVLNTNGHEEYAILGRPIQAVLTLDVQ